MMDDKAGEFIIDCTPMTLIIVCNLVLSCVKGTKVLKSRAFAWLKVSSGP